MFASDHFPRSLPVPKTGRSLEVVSQGAVHVYDQKPNMMGGEIDLSICHFHIALKFG